MKVKDIVEKLGLKVFNKSANLEAEISSGFVGDLLSHVMGNSLDGQLWITVQTHKNVLAIASLNDLSAVLLIDDLEPDKHMLEAAEGEGIAVLGTDKQAFEIAGEIHDLLK